MIQVPVIDPVELQSFIERVVHSAIETKISSLTPYPKEEFLTRNETSKVLGIALSTLHEYTISGKIPAYRLGSRVRYKRSEIEAALQEIKSAKAKK